MHRQKILSLLADYQHRFPEEIESVHEVRAFVTQHEDCFSRSQLKGHVTGSAWLLDTAHNSALLTHHKKLDIWVQLGGHADGESNIELVALREAQEESGIDDIEFISAELFDLDIHLIPERKSEPAHFHYDCRFLLKANTDTYTISEESHDLRWIPLQQVNEFTEETSVLRMVNKTPLFVSGS